MPDKPKITEVTVRRIIKQAAANLRSKMRKAFENNLLSLKIDGAKYHERKFLGITGQTRNMENIDDFSEFTLGCTEFQISQTTLNYKKILFQVLETFGVEELQILSLTTDNAPNICGVAGKLNAGKQKATSTKSKDSDDDEASAKYDEEDYQLEEVIMFDGDENQEEEEDFDFNMRFENLKRLVFTPKNLLNNERTIGKGKNLMIHIFQISVFRLYVLLLLDYFHFSIFFKF